MGHDDVRPGRVALFGLDGSRRPGSDHGAARRVIDAAEADVLILGAGGAGLCAALHAADASPKLRVTVVVKGLLGRAGCTRMVQGGYNAVLTEPDSLEAHLVDTLAGGGFINDHELVCALVTDLRTGRFVAIRALATLLAMGGGPTMYRVIACSADKAADGVALAYRAGLPLRDMEMVQFHPTGLVIPGSLMTGALLEEGLRGAGGHLRNGRGERFMERYDPRRMERSTRDLVARAAFLEVAEGRGTPNGAVWIDVSHLGAEVVETNFRGMVKRCRDFGRDLARGPVEVGPTTHFMMGGVVIDTACRTAIEGLFAAGEDTGGVHGANRLGGNGVAESTVFGGIAGDVMAEAAAGRPLPRITSASLEAAVRRLTAPLARAATGDLYDLQRGLREVMWEQVGLVRDARELTGALDAIECIAERLDGVGVPGGPAFNLAWQDWLNLESQTTAARLIALSALARRESRGAHFRRDFPAAAPGPPFSVRVQERAGVPAVWEEPVALTRATPDGAVAASSMVEIGD